MDLLLDVDIVIDLCTPRMRWFAADSRAIARCMDNGGRVWLYAGSVQTYQYCLAQSLAADAARKNQALSVAACVRLARRVLHEFTADKQWLAALAGEGDVFTAADCEDEQLLRAIDRFKPGSIKLLSRDPALLESSPEKVIAPDSYCAASVQTAAVGLIDLAAQQDRIRPQLESNLHRVLHHGSYVMGPEVSELERRLADYVGVRHCVAVSSGTDALLIALMALEIEPGDEVVTTPFTFVASAEVIALLGAIPRFVDIDPRTYNIDPSRIEAAIGPRTRVIMPVSLYGQCADMDAINAIAQRHGLPVVEDAAQSFGATYKGRRSCGLSTVGCTSFFPSKPLGGYGDGGACFTNDDELARLIRQIMNHGQDRRYHHVRVGLNGRLDSLQAAALLVKLSTLDDEVADRGDIGNLYTAELLAHGATPLGDPGGGLKVPYIEPYNRSVYAQYTLQSDNRDRICDSLRSRQIPTAIHYPIPLHRQYAYSRYRRPDPTANADAAANRVFSIPMHPYMSRDAVSAVVAALFDAPEIDSSR